MKREAAAGAGGEFFTGRDGTICGNDSCNWLSGSSARYIFQQLKWQTFARRDPVRGDDG